VPVGFAWGGRLMFRPKEGRRDSYRGDSAASYLSRTWRQKWARFSRNASSGVKAASACPSVKVSCSGVSGVCTSKTVDRPAAPFAQTTRLPRDKPEPAPAQAGAADPRGRSAGGAMSAGGIVMKAKF